MHTRALLVLAMDATAATDLYDGFDTMPPCEEPPILQSLQGMVEAVRVGFFAQDLPVALRLAVEIADARAMVEMERA